MKTLSLSLLILLSVITTKAQDEAPKTEYNHHQIGIHAGSTTGTGLSYRYWPGKFGIQATLLPVANEYNANINSGLTGLMTLKEFEKINLFLYLGNNVRYNHYSNRGRIYTEVNYSVGVGTGVEIIVFKNLGVNLMFGYGVYDVIDYPELNIAGEAGLYLKL